MINQTHYCSFNANSELVKFSLILVITTIWINSIFLTIAVCIIVIEVIIWRVREFMMQRRGIFSLESRSGLSEQDKQKLFSNKFKCSDDTKEECPICLGSISTQDNAVMMPGCSHVFHEGCVDKWVNLHSTCPYCRTPIEWTDQEENMYE